LRMTARKLRDRSDIGTFLIAFYNNVALAG
jgi:hypothetical protein